MRPKIEIEKIHPEPLPSLSQAVRRNYPNFCWTPLIQDSGFRGQESGKNFDNASAGASRATNSFAPSGQDVA
jgi:hypothetical protein